jgi:hypothetical protein
MKTLELRQKNRSWVFVLCGFNRKFVNCIKSIDPPSFRHWNAIRSCWEIHYSKVPLVVQFSQKYFSGISFDALDDNLKKVVEKTLKDCQTRFKGPKSTDPHEILYVTKNAPTEVIKASYKALAMKHHPDHGGNAETFKIIQEAYEKLKS